MGSSQVVGQVDVQRGESRAPKGPFLQESPRDQRNWMTFKKEALENFSQKFSNPFYGESFTDSEKRNCDV